MKTNRAPAVIIHRRHQSAAKTHWAEKEIQKAAEEIDGGRYIPDEDPQRGMLDIGLALGIGTSGVAKGELPTLEDFRATRDMNELAMHPRVVEAMERMKLEVEEGKTPQDRLEASWALREMTERQAANNKWDGQDRWTGKDNEAMRYGQLMTPAAFMSKLVGVIGEGRIIMRPPIVKTHAEANTWIVGIYIRNPRWSGVLPAKEYANFRAAELTLEAREEFTKGKRLRAAHFNAEADKHMHKAMNAIQAATQIRMEMSADEQLREPEFLRVGTLQGPLGTEWMLMAFDEFGVPTFAKFVGWRTALLTMIRARVITEQEAERAFPVGSGPAANWYLEQLYMDRNGGETVH